MKLPKLPEEQTQRNSIDAFAGYNHNLRINDNEFFEQENITSDYFPLLSQRSKRAISMTNFSHPNGLITKDGLFYVDEDKLYCNGVQIYSGLQDNEKQLVSMGAYLIIFPDKVMINTEFKNGETHAWTATNLEARNNISTGEVTVSMSDVNGESITINEQKPENPSDGTLWLDTSTTPHTVKRYSDKTESWDTVPTTYVKISATVATGATGATGISENLKEGDEIEISGLTGGASSLNGANSIYSKGTDSEGTDSEVTEWIVVTGIVDTEVTVNPTTENPVTVSRTIPDMDFVIESNNRLWGCFYGVSGGQTVNEIYACALGDPTNWRKYQGISTDSYAVSLGSDGKFTGAITYLGYPMFFKEECIHKIYGYMPSNYQVQTTTCRGVQNGSAKSMVIVNERLYYKSPVDVCVYDGAQPESVSAALGEEAYKNAVAGVSNGKYYISMQDSANEWHLFVFNTKNGLWNREDNTHVLFFANKGASLFYFDASDNKLKATKSTSAALAQIGATTEEGGFNWRAETGIIGLSSPDNKYISRMNLRLSLDIGSSFSVSIQYDSIGRFDHLFTVTGKNTRSFSIPILPKRCDHFRLRFSGVGEFKLYSIAKTIEQGSD